MNRPEDCPCSRSLLLSQWDMDLLMEVHPYLMLYQNCICISDLLRTTNISDMREVCQQSIIVQIVYGVTDVQLQQ